MEIIEQPMAGGTFPWPESSLSGKQDRPVFHPLRRRRGLHFGKRDPLK